MRRIFVLLLIIVGILLNFRDSKELSKIKTPYIYRYTISDLTDNKSIQDFVTDSLNHKGPYIRPTIRIKFAPLHTYIGGLTTQISQDVYFIQINSRYPLKAAQRILMHELIHVHQFNKGWLVELPNNRVLWKNDLWSWLTPWSERPWEIQAEEWSNRLYQENDDK